MQLTTNFKLEEFTRTYTGYNNVPTADALERLRYLCVSTLQPLRDVLGVPIRITSGYRSSRVNAAVGGARSSYHLLGAAADITFPGVDCDFYLGWAFELLQIWADVHRDIVEIIWYHDRHFLHVAALRGGGWGPCKVKHT